MKLSAILKSVEIDDVPGNTAFLFFPSVKGEPKVIKLENICSENKEQKPSEILQLLKDIELNYDIMIEFAQQKTIPAIDALKKDKDLVTIAIAKLMKIKPVEVVDESKSDSRKLPEFWYKFVNTGLTFKGHLIFLGPSVGDKQADKRTLTLLDKFIKRHMPCV